jgi:ubiquinone/menaquinone biosynthesis C-methylase UbiE
MHWPKAPNALSGKLTRAASTLRQMTHKLNDRETDKVFSGSIPRLYETYLVPLIFEPYAADLAHRLASRLSTRVLEVAAGTGVVTRRLASLLPQQVSIVATDLNQSMLDHASTLAINRPVEWRQADAMQLPFADEHNHRMAIPDLYNFADDRCSLVGRRI